MAAPTLKWETVRVPVEATSPLRALFPTMFAALVPATVSALVEMEVELPVLDAFPTPLEKVSALLQNAAEVEHALLVQYLYAAYALKDSAQELPDAGQLAQATKWRKVLRGIATEEMGHLMTVQNLLLFLDLPLHFERGDTTGTEGLHPFALNLEPVTKTTLAKYVAAEMPDAGDAPSLEIKKIIDLATNGAGMKVNRVGVLYGLLGVVFARHEDLPGYAASGEPWFGIVSHFADMLFNHHSQDPLEWHLLDTAFHPESQTRQATANDWGSGNILVAGATTRAAALEALRDIGEQGEGPTTATADSHFARFLQLYQEFPDDNAWQPVRDVPVNPLVSVAAPASSDLIINPRSRQWATLCDGQYHQLLDVLEHFLSLDGAAPDGATRRDVLSGWAFGLMGGALGRIAPLLTQLPRGDENAAPRAGAPFSIVAPEIFADDAARWKHHQEGLEASLALIGEMRQDAQNSSDPDLSDLLQSLETAEQKRLEEARNGGLAPPGPPPVPTPAPVNYARVQQILEEAVNNDTIGQHGNFWRTLTRDGFVAKKVFGVPLIVAKPDGSFDPDASNLIKALEGSPPFDADSGTPGADFPRMPKGRPPVPPEHIAELRQWIGSGCPM